MPRLAVPAMRVLASAGVTKLEDLTKFTEEEIMNLHGEGPNAMSKIRQTLKANGITFSRESQ